MVRAIRRAALVSDPEWADKITALSSDPLVEAEFADLECARLQARAHALATGSFAYCGQLRVRAAAQGMDLAELHDSPDLYDWLATLFGLDARNGETVRMRLEVELLPDEARCADA